jgi:hypothetical protein
MAMTCAECKQDFRTAEDYRDHLPCPGTTEEQLLRKAKRALVLAKEAIDELHLNNILLGVETPPNLLLANSVATAVLDKLEKIK